MRRYKLINLGFTGALAFASACGAESADPPSFEEFRASLDRFEGAYIVEGDILIHSEEALERYYLGEVEEVLGIGKSSQPLILNRVNGYDDKYTHGTQQNLTYCVSDDFDDISWSMKNDVVQAMETAADNWEAILDVDFRYLPEEDDDCDSANTNVWFNVRPSGNADGWAYAFYPNQTRSTRQIRVGDGAADGALMTHELGHTLGFRHEFERPEHTCSLNTSYRVLSPYDEESVMHYPANADRCRGSSNYTIQRSDTLGAQRIYGAPEDTCTVADSEVCAALGGACEPAFSTSGARHDLCRWADATTLSACNGTSGTWTYYSDSFAVAWPTAVPAGDYGACITQMNNISCSSANEDVCLRNGATCERAYSVTGHRHDLCRWSQAGSQTACGDTTGIWTTASSGFSQSWPTAVPDGDAGACITQVGNLD